MSDWFIQQSGFSSDKVLGPLTDEQVVALFVRGEINKKNPLASQQHTNNEWVLIKDTLLWPVVQEELQKQKEEKVRQGAALKQQRDEEKEQKRIAAESQRQQRQEQAIAMQQAAQAQTMVPSLAAPMPAAPGHGGRLVTQIGSGEISAVLIAGSIIVVVGALSIVGGLLIFIIAATAELSPDERPSVIGLAIASILYGFLTIGLGAALKVFGRMGQLLEQNTLTLLRLLDRS